MITLMVHCKECGCLPVWFLCTNYPKPGSECDSCDGTYSIDWKRTIRWHYKRIRRSIRRLLK